VRCPTRSGQMVRRYLVCRNIARTGAEIGALQASRCFQTTDHLSSPCLDLLLYCSGQQTRFEADTALHKNFSKIQDHWTMTLRYEGAIKTQQDSDDCDKALFDPSHGLLTLFSQYF
ncbi:MAG: hypothetical protein ONB44_09200, partial [candidate division KSB1 bacterium]|nr:hypothetical protein [candidate division KSB1 bacterium]